MVFFKKIICPYLSFYFLKTHRKFELKTHNFFVNKVIIKKLSLQIANKEASKIHSGLGQMIFQVFLNLVSKLDPTIDSKVL